MQFFELKSNLSSQYFLLVTLLLITATHNSDGYDYQQTAAQQNNGYIYERPPFSPPVTLPRRAEASAPAGTHLPVLRAVVRPLGSLGKNYEVRLSQSNQPTLLHGQPPKQAAFNGPSPYYTNNYQPVNPVVRYAPQTIPSHPRPYQQAFLGATDQRYSNNAAPVLNTPHQNPLQTPQYLQPASPPTFLTPTPQQTESFANHGNQQQPQSAVGSLLGVQQSNSVGFNGNVPNSQLSSAQSSSAITTDGSINGVLGNYISQSEVGQLDHYFEKQNPVGDTRVYTRLINTCYPDGHCEQQQLGDAQADQRHQHVVLTARARVQPISDKCRALGKSGAMSAISVGSVSVGNPALNSIKRPPNRRFYQYTEAVIPRDPFN